MQLFVHSRASSAALWIVSDGDNTVGPIRTELLLRGVKHGRVPSDCHVREVGSDEWRRLDQVREIAGLNGQGGSVQDFELAARDLVEARDEREVLLLLLHGAATATRAECGLLHRFRSPVGLPVTSYAYGDTDSALGRVLSPQDPAFLQAQSGQCLRGAPSDGIAEQLVAERLLDPELAGIVMVPVTFGTELVAMLELGRRDRGFRLNDCDALSRLATLAIARLEDLL